MVHNNQEATDSELNFKNFCKYIYFNRASKKRSIIDGLNMINILYIAIAVPFDIAFQNGLNKELFLGIELISVLIQAMVIFINIRTPIFQFGSYTLKIKPILKNYYHTGLISDIFGVLPINLICGYLDIKEPHVVFISLLRLTRAMVLTRLMELFEKLQIHLKNYSISMVVFKAFMFLALLWHWTSCIWFFINILEYDTYEITWIKNFNLFSMTLTQQYLRSMYYVIKIVTGVGQSDMIAYNNLERIVFILIINVGDALFAIAFGLIAEVQMHIFENSEFQQYLQKMKEIEKFLSNVNAEERQR